MDFDDTPEEASFRAEVRAWLAANARPRSDDADFSRHYHTAVVDDDAEAAHVRRCKQWQATLYHGGWAGITWPKEYGGRGASPMEAMIFNQDVAVPNPHELAELLAQKYPRIPMIVFTRREDAEDEIAYPFAAAVASSSGKAIVTALHQVMSEQADLESAADAAG